MSVQTMAYVIDFSIHKGSRLLTLLMIANHAHADGTGAFPSIQTLAKETRLSPRGVQYCIRKLKASGELLVERDKGPNRTNLYTVPMTQSLRHTKDLVTQTSVLGDAIAIAPKPSLTIQKIKSPPLPPVNCDGGHQKLLSAKTCGELQLPPPTEQTQAPVDDPFANDGFEYLYWAGRWFQIDMNGRKRLMTESERSGMSGCRAEQMLTFLHRKGFKARMMDDSELSYPSEVAYTASPAIPGQNRN